MGEVAGGILHRYFSKTGWRYCSPRVEKRGATQNGGKLPSIRHAIGQLLRNFPSKYLPIQSWSAARSLSRPPLNMLFHWIVVWWSRKTVKLFALSMTRRYFGDATGFKISPSSRCDPRIVEQCMLSHHFDSRLVAIKLTLWRRLSRCSLRARPWWNVGYANRHRRG